MSVVGQLRTPYPRWRKEEGRATGANSRRRRGGSGAGDAPGRGRDLAPDELEARRSAG